MRHSDKTRNQMQCKTVQCNLEQSNAERMGKRDRHVFLDDKRGLACPGCVLLKQLQIPNSSVTFSWLLGSSDTAHRSELGTQTLAVP